MPTRLPSLDHSNASTAPEGDQVPGTACNVEPTMTSPDIVGTGAVMKDLGATAAVLAEVRVNAPKPGFAAVTLNVTFLPTSAATGTYVGPVAPLISAPSTSHLRVRATDVGDHVPLSPVSTEPN